MTPEQISASFREARIAARALAEYPGGEVPANLDQAYAIQERGIASWPDRISGWKVATIQPAWRETYPSERLAGPVFNRSLWISDGAQLAVPVIENGYAAVEVEFALRIAEQIPASATFESPAQLLPYVDAVHGAIELAGSPLASLSALGPGAVASDFGNNSGLIVGPRLAMTLLVNPDEASSAAGINDQAMGSGSAARVPGGPLSALLFLVRHLHARGRTLDKGDWVSTGATTGIHRVAPGDRVTASFGGDAQIDVTIAAATPAA